MGRRSLGVALGLAAIGFLLGFLLVALAADQAGGRWNDPVSYTRWDQAHYLSIAEDGYSLISCAEVPGYPPDEWCGNAGWYPGYPALIRAVSALGLPAVGAAVTIANVALFGVLVLVAWARRDHPLPDRAVAVLGASLFPGAVYYRAAFPVSLMLLGVLGALVALRSGRWLPAGVCGALAVVSYPEGALLAVVAAPLVVTRFRKPDTGLHDLRNALLFLGCLAAALGAVLAVYQLSAGRWDAWFLVQEKYGHGLHSPVGQLSDRIAPITGGEAGRPAEPAVQTVLVAGMMAGLGAAAWWRRKRFDRLSALALAFCAVAWLFPLSLGSGLSLYRAESLLLPGVLLFGLLPRWLGIALVVVFGVLFVPMTRLFFEGSLS
jgi:hypothetical protein